MSHLREQVGGGHYKDMAIQPVEYIYANEIPFVEGCIIKYVSRHRKKGGVEDLKKARHFLDILIELESKHDAGGDQARPEGGAEHGQPVPRRPRRRGQ
jgi:UDP-3-O-acyl-N-acetylglucosamine deacetylase